LFVFGRKDNIKREPSGGGVGGVSTARGEKIFVQVLPVRAKNKGEKVQY